VRGQLWHRLAEIGVENQNIFQRLSIKAQCCRRRRSRVQRGKAAGEADIQRSIFFA
jgi:DNA-directed RNA polymerase subunit N (RpoN/RPB10)